MGKTNWLLKQGIFLSIISAMLALLSFVKEAVFANFFGISDVADAYTVAIQIPEILFAVVWEAIHAVIIPLYTEKLQIGGKSEGKKFISNILIIVSFISLCCIFLGEMICSTIVRLFSPGLSAETHALAVGLMRWIFPMLFFEGIIRVCTGILNVHNQFLIPKLLTAVRNVGVIVFLILLSNKFGVYAAAFGVLFGIIIESILIAFSAFKREKFVLSLDLKDPALKKAIKMVLPLIVGIGVTEINQMADKIVASFLDVGSIASLNYASKLSSIIQVVLLSNIATVLYPTFASLASKNRKEEVIGTYTKAINICTLICVPMIVGGFLLKDNIVFLAFARGAFDNNAVTEVANLFSFYLFTCLFSTLIGISNKIFASFCDTKTTAINSAIGVTINIVLNIILSKYMGALGLVIATLIASIVMCVRLYVLINKKIYKCQTKRILSVMAKCLTSGLLMYLCLFVLKEILLNKLLNGTMFYQVIYCAICVMVGAVIYLICIKLFKVKEADFLFSKLTKRGKHDG